MLSWIMWSLIELVVIAVVLYYGAIFTAKFLRNFGYSAQAAKLEAFIEKFSV